MKTERIDISGLTFGQLKVVSFNRTDSSGRAKWLCRCSCGNRRVCTGSDLRSDRVKACRPCARKMMGAAGKKYRAPVSLSNPAEIIPRLTPEQRQQYDRWESACRRFGVPVMPSERLQILREIVQ